MTTPHDGSAFTDRRYAAVWELAADAMLFLDEEGLLDCNAAGLRLLGLTEREALLGRPLHHFAPPQQPHGGDSRELIAAQVAAALNSGQSRFECLLHGEQGKTLVADVHLHRIPIGGGHIAHAVLRDITARWESERRLRYLKDAIEESLHTLTYYDTVTGLPNRAHFHEKAQQTMTRAGESGQPLTLACFAVNNLAQINNSLGHDAGDNILKEIAKRVEKTIRDGDIVARVSGNVFGISLEGCSEESAGRAAQALLDAMAPTIRIGEHEINLSVSIGLAIYDRDGTDLWTVLQNAETAMYRAKSSDDNSYQFFSGDMSAVALERLVMENRLRRALDNGEFVLHYQPLIAASSGRIIGVEALIRWLHPELGLIAPGRFIPLAEQCGLIVPMGEWVLDAACAQGRAWNDAGLPAIEIAVNLSPHQFRKPGLVALIGDVLTRHRLPAEQLVLELTEGALMDHTAKSLRTLQDLRDMGLRLAVDDFGTGYSSLAYLKQFPLHKLKVDRSFVSGLGNTGDDVVIAHAIVDLGRNLRLQVVAEGIETAAELAALRSYGCDVMQGFYFSKPVPAEEIVRLLQAPPHA